MDAERTADRLLRSELETLSSLWSARPCVRICAHTNEEDSDDVIGYRKVPLDSSGER